MVKLSEFVGEVVSELAQARQAAYNDALAAMIKTVGTNIFFEFIDLANERGILGDACTGRLSEYSTKENILNPAFK